MTLNDYVKDLSQDDLMKFSESYNTLVTELDKITAAGIPYLLIDTAMRFPTSIEAFLAINHAKIQKTEYMVNKRIIKVFPKKS